MYISSKETGKTKSSFYRVITGDLKIAPRRLYRSWSVYWGASEINKRRGGANNINASSMACCVCMCEDYCDCSLILSARDNLAAPTVLMSELLLISPHTILRTSLLHSLITRVDNEFRLRVGSCRHRILGWHVIIVMILLSSHLPRGWGSDLLYCNLQKISDLWGQSNRFLIPSLLLWILFKACLSDRKVIKSGKGELCSRGGNLNHSAAVKMHLCRCKEVALG